MTARTITGSLAASAPTVTVRELARRLRAVPRVEDVQALAAGAGVELPVFRDWSGEPAVSAVDAERLVAAVDVRRRERAEAKRQRERDRLAAETARDRLVAEAARTAYESAFAAGLRAGDRDVELRAWLASVAAGLDAQAKLAESEQPPAEQPQPRRWWQR